MLPAYATHPESQYYISRANNGTSCITCTILVVVYAPYGGEELMSQSEYMNNQMQVDLYSCGKYCYTEMEMSSMRPNVRH